MLIRMLLFFHCLLLRVDPSLRKTAKAQPVEKPRPPAAPRLPEISREVAAMKRVDEDRSRAVGLLYEAICLKTQNIHESEEKKAIIDHKVYQACLLCYANNVTRTEIKQIINAVVAEFRQPVS